MLVIDTDYTVNIGPILDRVRAPLVRVYAACDGCRAPLSDVRHEDSEWDRGWCWAQADRQAAGQRVEARVHRCYCAACWEATRPVAQERHPASPPAGQLSLFGGTP